MRWLRERRVRRAMLRRLREYGCSEPRRNALHRLLLKRKLIDAQRKRLAEVERLVDSYLLECSRLWL
jgi:hypothetical protein